MNNNTEQYFSEVPTIHQPRSVFDRSFTHKTTMDVNKLYPIFIDEALPSDSMRMKFQAFGRLVNPLVAPVMDELYFETLWFKSYMIILWDNTAKFFGERENPSDDNDYLIPTINSGNGFPVGSLADHFGIPVGVANLDVNALPFRMYNLVYNTWLRDQNLINSVPVPLDDSDDASNYTLLKSAKMHDLFTSCLPTTQINGDPFGNGPVTLSIGTSAPVYGDTYGLTLTDGNLVRSLATDTNGNSFWAMNPTGYINQKVGNVSAYPNFGGLTINRVWGVVSKTQCDSLSATSGLYADLTSATGININDLRYMIKLQQYREKLLSGGHRYNEYLMQFFGMENPNTPYIPEFLGMTREMIDINSVVQTSSTDSISPQGTLTAYGVINTSEFAFNTSFRYHGYLLGLARIRHNPVYQQGLNKLWSRSTLFDFYNPIFNGLGEQPVSNKEILAQGNSVLDSNGDIVDNQAFGFNEYAYEYRYYPSLITGQLRSGISQSLDVYHLAQYFGTIDPDTGIGTPVLPVLNQSFIEEDIPIDRVLSVNTSNNIPQFVMDFRFNYECARVMPVRNIPAGLTSGI